MNDAGPVYELRRYRLKPNMREALIELFEREFVEPQEQAGMTLHGLYRDRDDPNTFVWMRSFSNMITRASALATFYGGDVWKKWGPDANTTMLNSDNVLLLRPASLEQSFAKGPGKGGVVTISTCSLAPDTETEFAMAWENQVRPTLETAGARIDATFVTDRRVNSFRRLPVREGETVFVWVSAFADERALSRNTGDLSRSPGWTGSTFPWLDGQLWRPLETAVLFPTLRSQHGW